MIESKNVSLAINLRLAKAQDLALIYYPILYYFI